MEALWRSATNVKVIKRRLAEAAIPERTSCCFSHQCSILKRQPKMGKKVIGHTQQSLPVKGFPDPRTKLVPHQIEVTND